MRTPCLLLLAAALACRGDAPARGGDAPARVGDAPSTVASEPATTARAGGDPAAGHALLERYVAALRAIAASGDPAPMLPALEAEDEQLRALADKGSVSAAFRDRALRLLRVTRAIASPQPDEAAREATRAEVNDLVRAVRGPKATPEPGGGLASIAPILMDEVVDLHMLLDGSTDRDAARARYVKEP